MIGVRVSGLKRETQEPYHDVWQALIDKRGVKLPYLSPRKGEAVIWAANLLHGGSRQDSLDTPGHK
jgi:hypothetical protein